ncbi:MAG TPA: NUDIX domain-containing protein [Candidatus Marinimicrobia bacterium]|jgi:dATP pyrophosphohydrolase|nr:MAG: NUDIX pyrophosphatase [Candidatus Neomarinimicrobiota bacterium]HIA23893.1 NUDIX domain-containing protein [Candidatus Neomarinimicrobiota bacterium]
MTDILVKVVDAYVYRKAEDGLLFLILKRAETKMYEHLWQGVAGKIEAGETAPLAAIRELDEETGLKPRHMFIADHISRFYEAHDDRINLVPVFGIEVDSDDVTLSEEHCDYKWVTLDEALEHLVWRGQKKGIQVINEMVLSADERMRWSTIELE